MDVPAQAALIDLGGVDHGAVPHQAVPDHGVGADLAVLPDDRTAPEDGARQDHRARADGHPGVNIGGGGVQDVHAGVLVVGGDILLHRLLEPRQLRHGVEREHHASHREHGLVDLLDPASAGVLLDVPLVGVQRAHRRCGLLGEAGGDGLVVLRVADNKKPPNALFRPSPHTPVQYGAK